ncbi:MAG: alcohol dehydrogenase catalytic domain-containing protein, partial [Tannerella sp.]|nr:alcohol dehydrogenase catalytic domain-containing protein [Tannerella sp.]
MKSIIVTTPGHIEIWEVEIPSISPYQALVRTEMVAFCNATDSKLIAGKFPGENTYPMGLGHENAGIVEKTGSKVRNFAVGDRVIGGLISSFGENGPYSAWGGFSEYVIVNDFDVLKEEGLATPAHGCWDSFEIQNKIPKDIGPEEGVISCTWREVLGAFKDFRLEAGKKVLIFGSGPVGLSFVKLGKLFGLGQIDVVDLLPSKLEAARKMGADHTYTPEQVSRPEFIVETNRSYDAIIDAVGTDVTVNSGLPLLKMTGDM